MYSMRESARCVCVGLGAYDSYCVLHRFKRKYLFVYARKCKYERVEVRILF